MSILIQDGSEPGAGSFWTLDRDVATAARLPIENPDPVLRFNRNGRVIFANRASRALLVGLEVSEDGLLPEKWQRIIEEALTSEQQPLPTQSVYCEGKWYALNLVPILDAGCVNMYGRDITVRRAERELFVTIMENTRAQLAYLDPQFNFITVNSAYVAGCGHSREELIGRNHFDLFPNPENQAIFERVRDTGQGVEFRAKPFEYADQPARGTTYWDWTLVPVCDGEGPVKGLVFSLVDVTDRIRAEKLSEALDGIHTSINSARDFSQIVRRVIAEASAALGCDSASLVLREGDHWLLSEAHGLPENALGQTFTDDESPYTVLARQTRDVCQVENALNDPLIPRELAEAYGVQSFMALPLTVHNQIMGTIFFNYSRVTAFTESQMNFARKLAVSVSLALENARLVAELEQRVQERTAELQAYSRRIMDVLENERHAIARELHDEAGQVLTSLKVGIGLLQRDEDCPASFGARLEELKQTTDEVMDSLRKLAMDLRPGVLDRAGLVPAVRQYADTFRQQTGMDVEFVEMGFDDRHLPGAIATNLYRMVQEALTNVARHARADHVGIVLQKREGKVYLVIEDNGAGFDLGEALQKGHLGLVGMRERAEIMEGDLHIETAPGQGTTLYVEVPCGDK